MTVRVIVSPHPDDAVWSCGGVPAEWCAPGQRLVVVTVFSAARSAPGRAALRRHEDAASLAGRPVELLDLGLTDAAERTGADGRPRYRGPLALRRRPHPEDEPLVAEVARMLAPVVARAGHVLAPLADGTHVDHEITRRAVQRLRPSSGVSYYQEFPYAAPGGGAAHGLRPVTRPADFDRWLSAALVHASQVRALFGGPSRFARALHRYAHAGGRCGWREWVPVEGGPHPAEASASTSR